MKLNAILGKGTGKLGGMVLSVNSGEQIVREYNPKVSNPQTDAQVAQRAKFKLLSQIAAALSTSIAFRKMKMQSPRNRFVSANISNATFENNEASVALDSLDLTGGSQLIPTLSVTRGTGEAITIALSEAAAGDIKRIVYNIYKVTDGSKLQFIKEVLVSEAGAGRTFSVETTAPEADIVVYAYGIKDTTTRSTTKFEEYEASADDNTAVLDVLRALNSTDYVLTATAGEVLPFSGGGWVNPYPNAILQSRSVDYPIEEVVALPENNQGFLIYNLTESAQLTATMNGETYPLNWDGSDNVWAGVENVTSQLEVLTNGTPWFTIKIEE